MLPITPFPNGVSEDSHSKTKDLVEALFLEGLTVTEIARRLGVSKPTVCFHMRTLGPGCEECGIAEWRGRPLSLERHHANGDGTDNRIENLQLLCPNCHSQTDTWGGRNARRKAA